MRFFSFFDKKALTSKSYYVILNTYRSVAPVKNLDRRIKVMAKGKKKARKAFAALCKALAEILTAVLAGVITELVIRLLLG